MKLFKAKPNNSLENLFKEAWHNTFETKDNDVTETINKYFAAEFIEEINNNRPLNFTQFIEHVKQNRANSKIAKIKYLQFVEEGNKITCFQEFNETLLNGSNISTKVMMIGTVKNGKFTHLYELAIEPVISK